MSIFDKQSNVPERPTTQITNTKAPTCNRNKIYELINNDKNPSEIAIKMMMGNELKTYVYRSKGEVFVKDNLLIFINDRTGTLSKVIVPKDAIVSIITNDAYQY